MSSASCAGKAPRCCWSSSSWKRRSPPPTASTRWCRGTSCWKRGPAKQTCHSGSNAPISATKRRWMSCDRPTFVVLPCNRLPFGRAFPVNDKRTAANQWRRDKNARGGNDMKTVSVSRRAFLKSSKATAVWLALSPAIVGRAQAATTKLKCSSSLPNDPKYANGRVYYDNQLGQEIDVINSVKLGVIDLMVSGSSISANLVPLVGTFDLGYLFSSF